MGYYNCAFELTKAGLRPKSIDFYSLKKDYFVEKQIDFKWFIESLEKQNQMKDREANKYLFINKEKKNLEGVFDPREKWGDFLKSILLFQDPKIIPLSSLP